MKKLGKRKKKSGKTIDYYNRTFDFISDLPFESASSLYKNVPTEPTCLKKPPLGVDDIEWYLLPSASPEQFIATVPRGRIWGQNGTVIAPNGKLLWDISFEYNTTPKTHPINKQQKFPPICYTSETLGVVTFQVSFNYYHWLFDVLHRLIMIRDSSIPFDRIVLNRGIHYNKEYCKYQDESLELLGVKKDTLIQCNAETHIQANKLIVSSLAGHTAHVPKNVCLSLRKEFLEKRNLPKQDGYQRIFISREDASHRRLLNEEEVFAALEKHGFKRIKLSSLSFIDKIHLFHCAEVIVSPHGAGLANLIFCNPDTTIIELFPPTYLIPCFYIISSHMDLDYYYVIGDEVPPDPAHKKRHESIVINIDKLEKTLQLARIG